MDNVKQIVELYDRVEQALSTGAQRFEGMLPNSTVIAILVLAAVLDDIGDSLALGTPQSTLEKGREG